MIGREQIALAAFWLSDIEFRLNPYSPKSLWGTVDGSSSDDYLPQVDQCLVVTDEDYRALKNFHGKIKFKNLLDFYLTSSSSFEDSLKSISGQKIMHSL